MSDLALDLETFSETPIKNGVHSYAETSEILLVACKEDLLPTHVSDVSGPGEWEAFAPELQKRIDAANRIIIHNSAFDRTVLRHHGVHIPVEKIVDTMVLAMQHSLPGALGMLCDILGVPVDKAKDKDGKKLINLFSKPRPKNMKLRRATRETHPDEWQRFIEYAKLDVDACDSVLRRLPDWNDTLGERELWRLDQRINDRGVAVDVDLARSALRAFERASRSLAARAGVLTEGAVASATQRDAFLRYLREEHGVEAENMTGETVNKLLAGDVTDEVRELLEIRQQAAATSPAKYKALLGAVSRDNRLRGAIQFCGAARTGRDAGRIFQPQNLPRTPDWFDGEVQELTIQAFKHDAEDILWENVSDRCAMAVRGALVAEPGNKLVIADLSNIEGRVLAWIAGEEWKLEAFKAYDRGEGHDLYKVTAGRILGKDPGDITKTERQLQGKVPELAGGYQGSIGAYRKMGGAVFNAMGDGQIQDIVYAWRAAHPRTKSLWYDIENAAKAAIRNPGDSFDVRGMLRFDVRRDGCGRPWLRMRLPSGRYLCYLRPQIDGDGDCSECAGTGEVNGEVCRACVGTGRNTGSGQILYEGMNQYTRQWSVLETYGGKLTENAVQAIARDVFFSGMVRAMEAGYFVVLRVHDELVCEVPDSPDYTSDALAEFMATNPSWAHGLPLAAAGFETHRYRKE